ncbi:MAG TPA: fatty acid desaturase, partial [Thermoanaerobaculia bacterium]|nr:fatty acid desaturase [Thermoanaerobaculia bacterium]
MSANPASSNRPEEYPPAGGDHFWVKASRELRHRLAKEIPHEVLKELHRKSPARHFAITARQFLLFVGASAASWIFPEPWIWIPAALVAGWTAFNFTVLLHEVVHRAVFNGSRPGLERALAILYAIPSGISALQFTRWHLTHHAELGDSIADPKRHYLSPKINKAWFKLLYFTPALFPIYFRAARQETASYPPHLQLRIAWERRATIAFHVAVMVGIFLAGGWGVLARVYLVP